MKRYTIIFSIISLLVVFSSCSNREDKKPVNYTQYNISILLDLSDRVEPSKYPEQINRDKEIVNSLLSIIKENINRKLILNTRDKIRVFFYPQPDNKDIAEAASRLNVDFAKLKPKERKATFNSIDSIFSDNINLLYNEAVKSNSYPGADIWRFFRDDAKIKCIDEAEEYVNILVVVTDGYIYWENTRQAEKNRFTYILPNSEQIRTFRNDAGWEKRFESNNYGLLSTGTNLEKLKVLVLEVNPAQKSPEDYDIIRKYLGKWFEEMGIKKEDYMILKTGYPVDTKSVIEKTINKW